MGSGFVAVGACGPPETGWRSGRRRLRGTARIETGRMGIVLGVV